MKKKYKNQAHLLMWVTVLCALLINVGCIPSDVVKIDFKNVVENKVYNVTPNIMLDYTVGGKHAETAGNSKEFNDFIRNRVTVRVNSTDVTKYFKFEKYTATLKNKTAFTEHFIPGRNHITINNTADEASPYGKKERIINEMIIEYTNGEADISITKFEPIGNYIDVEGYASNGNLPIVISINDVYAEQEENGMFYAKIPAATSYQVKVKTLGSKTTVKQYNGRGVFIRPAIKLSVNEELLNQGGVKEAFSDLMEDMGELEITGELDEFVNPLNIDLFGIITLSLHLTHFEPRGGVWNSLRFLDPDIEQSGEINPDFTILKPTIRALGSINFFNWFILHLGPLSIDSEKINIDATALAAADEQGKLYLGIEDLLLDFVKGRVYLDVFPRWLQEWYQPIVSCILNLFEGMMSDLIKVKLQSGIEDLIQDVVLGSVVITDILQSDIKITNIQTKSSNMYIQLRTGVRATVPLNKNIGALASTPSYAYSYGSQDGRNGAHILDVYEEDEELEEEEKEIFYVTTTVVHEGQTHIVTKEQYEDGSPVVSGMPSYPHHRFQDPVNEAYLAPIFDPEGHAINIDIGSPLTIANSANVGVAIGADLINQVMLGLQEANVLNFNFYPNVGKVELGGSILEPQGTQPGHLRIGVQSLSPVEVVFSGQADLVTNVTIPAIKIKVESKTSRGWDPLIDTVIHIRAGAGLRIGGSGHIYLKLVPDAMDFNVLDLDVLGTDVIPRELLNTAFLFIKPVMIDIIGDIPLISFSIPEALSVIKDTEIKSGGNNKNHIHVSTYIDVRKLFEAVGALSGN